MHYVYILRSSSFPSQIYKGSTGDLNKRLQKHNDGRVPHSSKYAPWSIEWYSVFRTKEQAQKFERYLKSGSGIAFMRKRLLLPR
ncbi:MAG: GIY-YIG nuclease family protein [Parcubacteria group bacterium]|nr:GIY-YIG nuclease family protein [Parcubacteria group bacterium]